MSGTRRACLIPRVHLQLWAPCGPGAVPTCVQARARVPPRDQGGLLESPRPLHSSSGIRDCIFFLGVSSVEFAVVRHERFTGSCAKGTGDFPSSPGRLMK